MKRIISQYIPFILTFVLLLGLLAVPVSAASTSVLDGKITLSDTVGNISGTSTVTATASASKKSNQTNTITLTNNTEKTARITFDWSASKSGLGSSMTCTVDGDAQTSGSFDKNLEAGSSITITLYLKAGNYISASATLTLSNFSYTEVASTCNVTVSSTGSGTVTLDGATVTSGTTYEVSPTTGAALVATPVSGATFLGWVNTADNKRLSSDASYTLIPSSDMTVQAVFVKNDGTSDAWFLVDNEKMTDDLNVAVTLGTKVVPMHNGTLPAGNYTIPSGVTLLIPYDAANTLCTTAPSMHDNAYTAPSMYRTLTMASGANITVNGAISVSGSQSSKYAYNGMPSGPLGFIKMNSGSTITVNSGANLYAWGYITGSGSIEINSGGKVYECFQIADYRGGDATSTIVGKDDTYGVFPFNQYYLQNIEVPLTLHAGAVETGYGSVSVTLAGTQKLGIPFIGASDSMFVITDGYIVKDYIEGTGRTEIKVYGGMNITEVSIGMKVALIGSLTIDTSKYALPIPHHFTVSVESGGINMNQSIAFLPGSELYVKEGTTVTLGSGKKIYIYDLDQWLYNDGANGYSGTTNKPYVKTKYVPGGDGTTGRAKDAKIQIDGTIDASAGSVYVTAGGANIYSTGTGVVKVASTTDAVAYQVITADTDVSSWPGIDIQPAILQDGDGTDVNTTTAGTYTYYATTGKWCPPGHRYESTVTAPTCTAAGYTTHTCIACGNSYTDTEVAALGHTEVVDAAVAATCTTAGKTEGKHCSVCGTVIVAQSEVAAHGHKEVADAAVAATCTSSGLTAGSHCSVCNEVIVKQEEVPQLGHTPAAAVKENETDTSYESVVYCSVCNAEISRETIQTATYSVTITWEQTDVAEYTPGQTTYTWDPEDLTYTARTEDGKWTGTSIMNITIDNSASTGAVTASITYTPQVAATQSWTGLTDGVLPIAAEASGVATLTLTPTGTPTAPTGDSKEIILGTITITLTKGG